ncbi:ent-3 [Cordylochernes scorpioides]|uniref:Ent-3 n=1 Tax=Cordylochernes scorpioides TaxID=51811 RepID=A0ABY6KJ11_9ARAC|nr:ent-3 [Cordylochernes scorpioides]
MLILQVANGIYQSTVYGVAAKFPKKYTSGVILGTRDIARPHVDGIVRTFLHTENVRLLSARSPDLSLIENVWSRVTSDWLVTIEPEWHAGSSIEYPDPGSIGELTTYKDIIRLAHNMRNFKLSRIAIVALK